MIALAMRLAAAVGVPQAFRKVAGVGILAIAAGLAVWALLAWDRGRLNDARREGRASAFAEVKARSDRLVAAANKATAKATDLAATINREERARADLESRRIAADAADIRRLRPHPAVQCRAASAPAVPRAAGGGQAAAARDAALGAVHSDDWIAVPRIGLIDRAEQCDLIRSELLAWRGWYPRQAAVHEQWRREWIKAGAGR